MEEIGVGTEAVEVAGGAFEETEETEGTEESTLSEEKTETETVGTETTPSVKKEEERETEAQAVAKRETGELVIRVLPAQDLHERRLARPVFTHQGVHLASPDAKGHVIQRLHSGKFLRDMVHLQNVIFHVCKRLPSFLGRLPAEPGPLFASSSVFNNAGLPSSTKAPHATSQKCLSHQACSFLQVSSGVLTAGSIVHITSFPKYPP